MEKDIKIIENFINTLEEKKAIERCEELIKDEHKQWIGISNQVAIETLLNLLEKRQKEIEKLKEHKKDYTKKRKNYISLYKLLEKHLEKEKQKVKALKQEIEYLNCVCESDTDNYISKEAIREKIVELDKCIVENDKLIVECRKTIMENQPEKKIKIAKARMDNAMYYEMIKYLKELLGECVNDYNRSKTKCNYRYK